MERLSRKIAHLENPTQRRNDPVASPVLAMPLSDETLVKANQPGPSASQAANDIETERQRELTQTHKDTITADPRASDIDDHSSGTSAEFAISAEARHQ